MVFVLRLKVRQPREVRLEEVDESALLLFGVGVLGHEIGDVLACGAVGVEQQRGVCGVAG